MVKNNDKLFLSSLLLLVFFIHFLLYGPDLFSCLFEDMCFYYHTNFYFIGLNNNIYLNIYFETLSFYLILAIVFFSAYKLFFFTKSKFNNYILNTKDINLKKFINILFLFYLLYFVIQNQEHFSSIENLVTTYRYKYNPQSLTILWLLGSISSWVNLSSKKYFFSILIMIPVIFFLFNDGSRLWTLVFFLYFNLFLINFFFISNNFFLISFLFFFGLLLIYANQMANPNWRIYNLSLEKKETFLLKNSNISGTSGTSSTSSTKNDVCDIEMLIKLNIFVDVGMSDLI